MALGDIITAPIQNTRTDLFGFNEGAGPDIINVLEGLQAITWCGNIGGGAPPSRCRGITVNADGTFGLPGGTANIGSANIAWTALAHVTGNVYAVAQHDPLTKQGIVTTFSVSVLGAITVLASVAVIADLAGAGQDIIDIVQLSQNRFAIFYTQNITQDGIIQTISISDDGLTIANIAAFTFEAVRADWVSAIQSGRNDNIYIIVYFNAATLDGWVRTVNINPAGTAVTPLDVVAFDAGQGRYPFVTHIINNVYGISYRGPGDDGWMRTIEVGATGLITLLAIVEYYNANITISVIIHVGYDMVAVFYHSQATGTGHLVTISVGVDGLAPAIYAGPVNWGGFTGHQAVVRVPDTSYYILVYRQGAALQGWTASFEIDSFYPPIVQTNPATEVT